MNLNFDIDKMWPKRSFIQRWAARIVAKMLLKKDSSYQCYGETNWVTAPVEGAGFDRTTYVSNGKADIQVPAIQMAHWILRESGYSVCQADIKKRIGLSPDRKDREEGRDSVEQSSG